MKILFLSQWFPFPANNGSKLRIQSLLRGLAEHHDITLLSFTDQPDRFQNTDEAQSICRQVQVIPWREFNPNSLRAGVGFFDKRPRFLRDTYSKPMENLIRQTLSGTQFDLVIASQIVMASYHPSFRGTPWMFEEIEVGQYHDNARYTKNLPKRLRFGMTWLKLRRYLSQMLGTLRTCTVASRRELELLVKNFPASAEKMNIIPNCVALKDYEQVQAKPIPNQLIFTGSFRYPVNYQAMKWFLAEVFPIVLERLPQTCLVITGEHANLPLPAVPNVVMAGEVQDIRPLICSSWVSIAPLLSGGGTRLKILEAMALGAPVVSTSKGAEGLEAVPSEDFLIADSAAEFAGQIIQLLGNRALHDQIAARGRKLVKQKYDWESTMPRFLQLVEEAAR